LQPDQVTTSKHTGQGTSATISETEERGKLGGQQTWDAYLLQLQGRRIKRTDSEKAGGMAQKKKSDRIWRRDIKEDRVLHTNKRNGRHGVEEKEPKNPAEQDLLTSGKKRGKVRLKKDAVNAKLEGREDCSCQPSWGAAYKNVAGCGASREKKRSFLGKIGRDLGKLLKGSSTNWIAGPGS